MVSRSSQLCTTPLCLPWPTRVGILHWGASAVEKPPLTVLVPLSITMLCPITPSCLLSGFMAGVEEEMEEDLNSRKLSNHFSTGDLNCVLCPAIRGLAACWGRGLLYVVWTFCSMF